MRTTAKIIAATALLALSAAAQAATWTGTLAGVKITYFANNTGPGLPAVQLTGTGTTCTFPAAGTASFYAGTAAEAEGVRTFYEFLLHAKATNASITLDYTTGGFCNVNHWIRN